MAVLKSTILQVGDVHYPEAIAEAGALDLKDMAFPAALQSKLSVKKISHVTRHAMAHIDRGDVDLLVFVGDLTTRGDTAAYESCIEFINGSLNASLAHSGKPGALGITPGNHDVVRNHTLDVSLIDKFRPFQDIHSKHSIRPLPVGAPEIMKHGVGATSSLDIALVNSCVGCGERKLLPNGVRDALIAEIERQVAASAGDKSKILEILYRSTQSIDTPMIDASNLIDVDRWIRNLPQTTLPVICAHHNFLPQGRPRVDAYTDLLNAGALRRMMLDENRPVVFLHGHIHDDPVDVISDPRNPHSTVVSISAPLMRDGFNLVTIAYSPNGVPVGCRITGCRLDDNGRYEEHRSMIPLWRGHTLASVLSQDARQILELLEIGHEYYPNRLREVFRKKRKDDIEPGVLKDRVEELEWLGLVTVEWAFDGEDGWRVRKAL